MPNDELLKEIKHLNNCAEEMKEVLSMYTRLQRHLEYGIERGLTIEEFHKDVVICVKDTKKLVKNYESRISRKRRKNCMYKIAEYYETKEK